MSLTASHPSVRSDPEHVARRAPAGWAARKVIALLESADVRLDGSRPWDITVHDERLFRRLIVEGSVGLGDAYVDGWWDCAAVDQFVDRLVTADVPRRMAFDLHSVVDSVAQRLMNLQTLARARRNTERHYDLGNDLFAAMLDPTMTYTCGYWKGAATLEDAQIAKMDLICRKVGLARGQRLLDIGCGWGSLLRFAAERYGAAGVGVTISGEQLKLARERCAGLPIEIRLQDYRDVDERFDHVASLGMFEHVGANSGNSCWPRRASAADTSACGEGAARGHHPNRSSVHGSPCMW